MMKISLNMPLRLSIIGQYEFKDMNKNNMLGLGQPVRDDIKKHAGGMIRNYCII